MRNVLIVTAVVAACAPQLPVVDRQPRNWEGNMSPGTRDEHEAQAHDRAVAEATAGPTSYSCGDTMHEQSTTGTERVSTWNPCWDIEEETAARHRGAEAAQRYSANLAQGKADALVQAQLVHCKGIPEHELAHSPFAHRKAIREVTAHRSGGEIRGVRVLFKDIPGLTADYLRSAIACHRARYETLGRPAQYLPEDPTLFQGAEVVVSQRQNGIEVLITADDPTVGRIALDRAQDLVRSRTATR
jgi:hypothetical protein